jgi:alpha-L-arabinofuranosidase
LRFRWSKAGVAGAVLLLLLVWFIVHTSPFLVPLRVIAAERHNRDSAAQGPTVVDVSPVILRENVIRLGMNLGNESVFDSQDILKNLLGQNPGFEGGEWRTVMECGRATATSCTDAANSGGWPTEFMAGGSFEVLTGGAAGETGKILHSTASDAHTGVTVEFAPVAAEQGAAMGKTLAAHDFIAVRRSIPGGALDGWSFYPGGGATAAVEYKDLSPRTPGRQALRIDAMGIGQYGGISTPFALNGSRTYGPYEIRFRAKRIAGSAPLLVKLDRPATNSTLFQASVPLSGDWQDYNLDFQAIESARTTGGVILSFSVGGAIVLLDDVSLEEAAGNGTAFRNDVVATLERLRPGVLREMDSGQNFGCDLDNMLAPEFGRRRCGFGRYGTVPGGIPVGLHDFLVLAEKLHTEPWYTIQIGWSAKEAAGLMEYLGGPVTTKYGAVRAALGHPVPWTKTFPRIHLEFGNEAWNEAQAGAAISPSDRYAARATEILGALRASPWYSPERFNLIANTQAVWAGRTDQILKTLRGADMVDIAPYTFTNFGDDSSIEHIFGPMLAEPQFLDDTTEGYVHQQAHAAAAAAHPARLAVYENNIGTTSGTASQAVVNAVVPSLGAGLSAIEHELLMLRDLGITVQNTFSLGGSRYHFYNSTGTNNDETSPVWGTVLDMGGPTNRVRPSFLAEQLANEAIRANMLTSRIDGDDPTWDQPKTANDNFEVDRVHELQSFAFGDAASTTLVVFNLSRTAAHTVGLSGACAPRGEVRVQTLTAAKITDNNEQAEDVKTVTREEHNVVPGRTVFSLPPFSMTSLASSNQGCVPVK